VARSVVAVVECGLRSVCVKTVFLSLACAEHAVGSYPVQYTAENPSALTLRTSMGNLPRDETASTAENGIDRPLRRISKKFHKKKIKKLGKTYKEDAIKYFN